MARLFLSEDDVRAAWDAHGAELTDDAARYGFRPAAALWFEGGWRYGRAHPIAVTADWRRQFMHRHAVRTNHGNGDDPAA